MNKYEFAIEDWVIKNKKKIIDNITSKHDLFTDKDVINIISGFSYRDDIRGLPYILFPKISKEIVDECIKRRFKLDIFLKAIERAARFSCLADYTHVFKEDLLEEFPYHTYISIFQKIGVNNASA